MFFIFLSVSYFVCQGQDTYHGDREIIKYDTIFQTQNIIVEDTLYLHKTHAISVDTIKSVLLHSEYNRLYEQSLDQKQKHYDSALDRLEWVTAIFGILITILVFIMGFLGYNSINNIKKEIKEELREEKNKIAASISDEAEKLSERNDPDIKDIKEKVLNLERYAEDASDSFSVKKNKSKPELNQDMRTSRIDKNPFD